MTNDEMIARLSGWGCNMEAALTRTAGDKDFYTTLLTTYKDTLPLAELRSQVADGKVKEAFETAHMLKGVLGNLGLDPMYRQIGLIVEPLRAGSAEGLLPLVDTLIGQKAELDALLKD